MDSKEIANKERVKEINRLAIMAGVQHLLANPNIEDGIGVNTTILGSKGAMKLEYSRDIYDRFGSESFSTISIVLINPKDGVYIAQRNLDVRI